MSLLASLRGRAFLLLCGLTLFTLATIVSMYEFDYGYFGPPTAEMLNKARVAKARADFESYLQMVHSELHSEDLRTFCAATNLTKSFLDSAEQRYENITAGGMEPFFVAANLHNSEKVLPNMAAQLLALADALGHTRLFVSIYENGSTDKTKEILHQFNATLDALGIAHRIVADDTSKPQHVHRIEYLAKVRNYALEPLYSNDAHFGRVVFLNDVYFCLSDLLELVFQSRAQDAHLVCAEDYDMYNGGPGFYDTWVARDMRGEKFRKEMHKITDDDISLVAQMRDRPFQVQCCWNGIAVIDSQVFRGDKGLRFRRSAKGECSASECSLMCNDMWHRGFNRMVMVPRVKLTYNADVRDLIRKPLYFPAGAPFSDPEVEKISFRPGPKKIICTPLNGLDSHHPDGPSSYIDL
ncbi:hypothetical protein GGI20_000465 [Coemansia sp. BCRC 34301]|nr:hypothetical protein GGI20_000465 [Coemansia sp. BCRC 34301]